jgi:TetR/AcrR family tetracycline transcriptional repressor
MKPTQISALETAADSRLCPQVIVTEAIRLLNDEGIEGVSLRRLAARLGIKAPSLYWHFADKSALLAAVIERLFDLGLDSVPPHRHWQDWMRAFGAAMWRSQAATRDFTRLVTTTNLSDEQLDRTMGKLRVVVSQLDLEVEEAMRIQASVQALVLGWSAFANAPYSSKLGQTLDFGRLAMENLDLLIAGETLKLQMPVGASNVTSRT